MQALRGLQAQKRGHDDFKEYGFHLSCHLCRQRTVHGHDSAIDADLVGLIGTGPSLKKVVAYA